LQDTILRSKTTCVTGIGSPEHAASSIDPDDSLVLLCFNRRPKELLEALLESPLAARVVAAGGNLKPEWAGGRLILAEGVTEAAISDAREAWHVAVRATDESEVDATLRSMLGRDRPRVKASDGRILVPHGTSLCHLSTSGADGEPQSSDGPCLASDWAGLMLIRRTFIDVPTQVAAPPRASASAPVEL